MTNKEKADKALQLVREIIEDEKNNDSQLGGIMRVFGDQVIVRVEMLSDWLDTDKI